MALPAVLAIAVNNSRSRLGVFGEEGLRSPVSASNEDGALTDALATFRDEPGLRVVVASVNDPVADRIPELARRAGIEAEVYRVGVDLPIPIRHTLDDDRTVGHDRLLNALGAYAKAEQACIVIDAGTAITVDFVDGEGTFCGGVIAPGAGMMLRALHEQTAALPEVEFETPDPSRGPFGKDTPHAMRLGVIAAARGLVQHQIDTYAEFYGGYPQVVATGGDAPVLFETGSFVEHIVPDLQLIGIYEACREAVGGA